jgi:hypothetical protein
MEPTRRKAARKVGREARDELRGAVFGGESRAPPRCVMVSMGGGMRHAAACAPWARAGRRPLG